MVCDAVGYCFYFRCIFIPDFSILGYPFKKLNLLADIQNGEQALLANDSLISQKILSLRSSQSRTRAGHSLKNLVKIICVIFLKLFVILN